jgi:hypothetical protein
MNYDYKPQEPAGNELYCLYARPLNEKTTSTTAHAHARTKRTHDMHKHERLCRALYMTQIPVASELAGVGDVIC